MSGFKDRAMPTCRRCGSLFPNRVKINGKTHCVNNRRYCLECSPHGLHNTKQLDKFITGQCTKCGRVAATFYGHKKSCCGPCHNAYTTEKGRQNRDRIVTELGEKCFCCGFDIYLCSLDVHHLDPTKKDPSWSSVRGWSWQRTQKEIANCVLLCRNCHAAYHAGLIDLPK